MLWTSHGCEIQLPGGTSNLVVNMSISHVWTPLLSKGFLPLEWLSCDVTGMMGSGNPNNGPTVQLSEPLEPIQNLSNISCSKLLLVTYISPFSPHSIPILMANSPWFPVYIHLMVDSHVIDNRWCSLIVHEISYSIPIYTHFIPISPMKMSFQSV